MGEEAQMSSQYKTYTVNAHKIEASDSLITGNNNVVFGNNNRIAGDNNKVYGNNNAIVGNGNTAKGENNLAKGDHNEVYDPFGNTNAQQSQPDPYSPSANPFATQQRTGAPSPTPHFFIPPRDTASPVASNSYVRPVPTRERSSTYPYVKLPAYEPQPAPAVSQVSYPVSPSPVNYPGAGNVYFQPIQSESASAYFQPPVEPAYTPVSPSPVHYSQVNNNNAYYQPAQQQPNNNAYYQQQPTQFSNSLASSNGYYQPIQQQEAVQFAPQSVAAACLVVASPIMQSPQSPTPYVNPFSPLPQEKKDINHLDLIQEGTLVFIVNETEAEYVREFCNLVSANSGQKLGCHISAGRMCLVGLGDLNKIRDTIIQNLPLLNLKLKEWSWNTFGKNVCSDKQVYYKRMFKEYTREDVDCWRNKPTKIAA